VRWLWERRKDCRESLGRLVSGFCLVGGFPFRRRTKGRARFWRAATTLYDTCGRMTYTSSVKSQVVSVE
jgi:hypothetical protein